jgi:signal recognition particle subunit SRP54
MGDILSLVEQAQRTFDQDEMKQQEERLRKGEFTLDDFRKMLGQTKKLGSMEKIMSMIPGMGGAAKMMDGVDMEQDMQRLLGIVDSMTPDERRNPSKIVDQSRRRRIAAGAGVEPHEVNELVKQFDAMAGIMKQMSSMGLRDRMKAVQQLGQSGLMNPGAKLGKVKQGTGKRLTAEERTKIKKQRERELRRKKREQKGK